MARCSRRLAANVAGPFYVDSSCIDCGTCWQWDPDHFAPGGAQARVVHQPKGDTQERRALLAQQACPVAAIGSPPELGRRHATVLAREGFPALLCRHPAGDVHYCGWASRRSFGASSYLVVRPQAAGGNVLIDSPRYNAPLARRIEALGGLAAIVLTHRDDVADQARWAAQFGCARWIHAADADTVPGAEHRLEGDGPVDLGGALVLLPTPGHTAGSLVAVLGEPAAGSDSSRVHDAPPPEETAGQILFSGDHLWWSEARGAVVASRTYCWWDFEEQLRSVAKLLSMDVRWLLPGHGGRRAFAPGEWRGRLEATLAFWGADPA
jgi:glyoxylase-like metal-dependent hydrolase (beta-lactamase superfamily II)/ferredoxin